MENVAVVVVLSVIWLFCVKFIYKPIDKSEWRKVWIKTSLFISFMYGLTWVMFFLSKKISLSDNFIYSSLLSFLIIGSVVLFVILWQKLVTFEKSVGCSALELYIAITISEIVFFDSLSESFGVSVSFLVFLFSLIVVGTLFSRIKKRFFENKSENYRLKWNRLSAAMVAVPFILAVVLYSAESYAFKNLDISILDAPFVGELCSWAMGLMMNAPYLFEEYI